MRKKACFITAFVVFIFQASILPFLFDGITQPNLIFLFVVLASLHHGKRVAVYTALLGGFTQDVILGNFFGIHLLPYLLISGIASYLGQYIEEEQWLLTILIVLAATALDLLLTCLVLVVSGQYINVFAYLIEFSVPMLIYHGILALPVNHLVWKLRRKEMYYSYSDVF